MRIRLCLVRHYLDTILNSHELSTDISILGQPLVVYNLRKLQIFFEVDQVLINPELKESIKLIETNFSTLDLQTVSQYKKKHNKIDTMLIPINSVIFGNPLLEQDFFKVIRYPWDLLQAMKLVFQHDVKEQIVSKEAEISHHSVIRGPCIIEEGVIVDDFSKIKGPVFIGKDSMIGTGSLIRSHTSIGEKSVIGFNCEIARSYFMGENRVPHYNFVGDSVFGRRAQLGGYVTTANIRTDGQNVKYEIDTELIDTGLKRFGAVVGHDCRIGVGTRIMPGRFVESGCNVKPGIILKENVKLQ